MGLVHIDCAEEIAAEYYTTVGIDSTTYLPKAGDLTDFTTWATTWSDEYHAYATKGDINGLENEGGDSGILKAAFLTMQANGYGLANIGVLAQGFADYWEGMFVTLGTAVHPGMVAWVSASNDSQSHYQDFWDAIYDTCTNINTVPHWDNLIKNVEAVVNTIKWTTCEKDSYNVESCFIELII